MVANLNFGLLQPVDLSGAVQAFDQARARRMQQQQIDTDQQRVQFQMQQAQMQADQEARARAAKAAVARQLIYGNEGDAPQMADAAPPAPLQAAPAVAPADMQAPASQNYGARADGTQKGTGFLGELRRPDGAVSTEISVGVNIDGKEVEIPTLVPTLTQQERDFLLSYNGDAAGIPDSIIAKAVDHARQRMASGRSPFAGEDAMMTVTAPRRPPIWDALIDADPDQAIALWEKSRSMADDERERVVASYDTLATAAADLGKLPYEQRRAALVNMAPMLIARGVQREIIDGFDPTDANLQAAANNALGLKEVFAIRDREADNQRAEREFFYRQQNDAANRAVTLRGQNMTDARQRELANVARQANEIKLTESQGKATGFLRLAQQAEATLGGLGTETPVPGEDARMAYGVPFIERAVGGQDRQVLAAQEAFAEASLRFLTGAAVTKEEARRNITQFYPAPGDTPEVIQQKAAYRQQVMAGMRDAAGPGAARVQTIQQTPPRNDAAQAPPAVGTVKGGYRFKGGDPARRTNWERVR